MRFGWRQMTMALAAIMLATSCAAQGTGAAQGHALPTEAAGAGPRTGPAAPSPALARLASPSQVSVSRSASSRASASASSPSVPAAPEPPPSRAAGYRLVTFVNHMNQTIWVAASPDPAQPLAATGWVLPAGQSVTITVPGRWNGRFWGRTGCVFSGGAGRCETGDCGGRFQCTGYGAIPATLAEYDMDAWDGLDFYDVSMVDGSNLPMWINIARGGTKDKITPNGCVATGCTEHVDCPAVLTVRIGGSAVGCESACARFGTDQYCCRGQWAARSACDPAKWPVDYAAVFKRAEPYAYSYADDDATSVFTCAGECDYRITFGVTR